MEKCGKKMTFEECEMAVLRSSMDKIDRKKGEQLISNPLVKKIITIVEEFIKKNKLICYGGTAINNILPKKDQFYNESEFPDYDFFSTNALNHAKQLADIYYKQGFEEVEAKAGIHIGTYKVFVNFIPVADITQIDSNIFKSLQKEQIVIKGIAYAPPNFLRMSAYLELSRPAGDITRWEKVLKRLRLLNKNYPIEKKQCIKSNSKNKTIFNKIKNIIIDSKLVFFGGYALTEYSNYLSDKERNELNISYTYDILSNNAEQSTKNLVNQLKKNNFDKISYIKHENIGEIIPLHYEILINNKSIIFIYQPIACYSYNEITINKKKIKVATIDTILRYYLAFLYSNKSYHNINKILCMAEFLYKVQIRNKFKQKGILKRFSKKCYGNQETLASIRTEKSKLYNQLKKNKSSKKYQKLFLKYYPGNKTKKTIKNKKNYKN